jgi:branched-chain amino acid transport system ATP-binding protein
MPLLELRSVTKAFGGLVAVKSLSCSVERGDIQGLIGPNGAGKTTIFNLITRHLAVTSGNIVLNGRDITGEPIHKIIGFGIARTFQGSRVFHNISVFDGMLTACYKNHRTGLIRSLCNTSSAKKERARNSEQVLEVLEFIGLRSRSGDLAGSLPYAHQSLLGIGMALVTEPTLLATG